MFREALKAGWYDLLLARDAYRVAAGEHGLHRDLVSRFLEVRPSAGVSCLGFGVVQGARARCVPRGLGRARAAPRPGVALPRCAQVLGFMFRVWFKQGARARCVSRGRWRARAAPRPGVALPGGAPECWVSCLGFCVVQGARARCVPRGRGRARAAPRPGVALPGGAPECWGFMFRVWCSSRCSRAMRTALPRASTGCTATWCRASEVRPSAGVYV